MISYTSKTPQNNYLQSPECPSTPLREPRYRLSHPIDVVNPPFLLQTHTRHSTPSPTSRTGRQPREILLGLCAITQDIKDVLLSHQREVSHHLEQTNIASALLAQHLAFLDTDDVEDLHPTLHTLTQATEEGMQKVDKEQSERCTFQDTMDRPADPSDGFWSSRDDSGDWNIALPGDDEFSSDSSDGLVVHTAKYDLQYHSDTIGLGPMMLFMPAMTGSASSRRVILTNLPPDTNLAQVVRGISCHGGIVSAELVPDISRKSGKAAVIHFTYTITAAKLIDEPPIYGAANGNEHACEAYLIPTPSYLHTQRDQGFVQRSQTRTIRIPQFPESAVWHFIKEIGSQFVVAADLDSPNTLSVEFTSLFEADKAARLLRSGVLGFSCPYPPYFVFDSAHFANELVPHIPANHLDKWNIAPYNGYDPHAPVGKEEGEEEPAKPTLFNLLAEYFNIDPDEVEDYVQEREHFQDVTYRIIGSNISLTRRKWSWSISAEDNMKLHMADTLHEPGWEDAWDAYFKARNMINIRTWERYAMYAKHRREGACCSRCAFGCVELKKQPVPAVVREFLHFKKKSDED